MAGLEDSWPPASKDSSLTSEGHQAQLAGGKQLHLNVTGECPTSSNRRQVIDSELTSTHECTDSCSSAIQMFSNSTMYTSSVNISKNEIKVTETTERWRIRCDGPGDYTIQYVGSGSSSNCYLKLNDCVDVYKLEMSTSAQLPADDTKCAKYMFNWIPKRSRAGFLKVMAFYAVLDLDADTRESPPQKLKMVAREPPLNDASLVCRDRRGDENFVLYFKYNNKRYVLKPDDQRGLIVEEECTDSVWRLDEH